MVPSFAPVIISKKRRRIIKAFRNAGATSSGNAKSIEEVGLPKSVVLEIQKLRGIIVSAGKNSFYLNEEREREVRRSRQILIAIFIVLVALIAWYLN